MLAAGGLAQTPIQELPLLYWVLLFLPALLFLLAILFSRPAAFPSSIISPFGNVKHGFAWGAIFSVLNGFLLLLVGIGGLLVYPEWGGIGATLTALGCMSLVAAYAQYRRHQSLE